MIIISIIMIIIVITVISTSLSAVSSASSLSRAISSGCHEASEPIWHQDVGTIRPAWTQRPERPEWCVREVRIVRADGWCEISRGESGQGVQGAFDILALATIIEGVAKLHAAAVVRRIVSLVQTQAVADLRGDEDYQRRSRCEVNYHLDGASLELHAHIVGEPSSVKLALMCVSRCILSGEVMEAFLGTYESVVWRSFKADVANQRVASGDLAGVLRRLTLGTATPSSRVLQWKTWRKNRGRTGSFDLRTVAAEACAMYVQRGTFQSVAEQMEQATSEQGIRRQCNVAF